MDLWNDYEGKTIAESFPLERLLYPEGRHGFFSTSNGTGTPAVIRLTESLNDQEEMLEQWKLVRALNHPNLILIKKYGHTVVDDTPLVYAVMEPSDASLAEMLRERAMTPDETMQIATSVTNALLALHGAGLVHGHVDPGSVLAVGEVVKLRSDCAFKRPEGADTARLQAQDVQDLAALLLEALTLRRDRRAPSAPLPGVPTSLDQTIRNGLSGNWGLKEIAAALHLSPRPSTPPEKPAVMAAAQPAPKPIVVPVATVAPTLKQERPAPPPDPSQDELPLDFAVAPDEPASRWLNGPMPYIAAAAVLLVCILAWYFFHPLTPEQRELAHSRTPTAASQGSAAASLVTAKPDETPKPAPGLPSVTGEPARTAEAVASPVDTRNSNASAADDWRVVVFTYNQESQARKKVVAITRHHQSMKPGVFTPNGQAPYLVTLGGPMAHDQASALQRKARSQGFPRDTYVQNYPAR